MDAAVNSPYGPATYTRRSRTPGPNRARTPGKTATAPRRNRRHHQPNHCHHWHHWHPPSRYNRIGKVHLEHILAATAINPLCLDAWWTGTPLQRTRTTHLARLDLALAA
jgi:hypothetical protein